MGSKRFRAVFKAAVGEHYPDRFKEVTGLRKELSSVRRAIDRLTGEGREKKPRTRASKPTY
jgi:hypothetical protein